MRYHMNEEMVDDDEVEDMYHLLNEILQLYPEIKGVACGAIASNYQRYRLENVCNRLHLIPLTYLWNHPRSIILDEIIEKKIDAVLVKVAGAGLEPYKHLGKSLSALRPVLHQLHKRYGLDLCGEGGEYESLVLDMPCFTRYRIIIDKSSIIVDEDDFSVGNLSLDAMHLEEKSASNDTDNTDLPFGTKLSSLADEIDVIARKIHLEPAVMSVEPSQQSILSPRDAAILDSSLDLSIRFSAGVDGLIQTSLMLAHSQSPSASEQLHEILSSFSEALQANDLSLDDLIFVHLYLHDMRDFATVNAEYVQWFHELPPSRSCISVSTPILATSSSSLFCLLLYRFPCRKMCSWQWKDCCLRTATSP
jgi:diphthine-ammonia ligase